MKKVISVLLVLVMVMSFAACKKKEAPQPADNKTTEAPTVTKDEEPTKQAETTPEPTKEPTPEPTKEPTPEPTQEPTPEPTSDPGEDDEWYGPGHAYDGLYTSENNWVMCIDPEGAADVITVYDNFTDKETFGTWHEFWTNFDEEGNAFIAEGEIFHCITDELESDYIEGEVRFEIHDNKVLWVSENVEFEKVSDDTSENPYYIGPGSYSGDVGDGFGATFTLENQALVDVVGTTYYGVYCQSASDPMVGSIYPYYGDEMSMETMDEFNAAFLYLGVDGDQGQLCFLEMGMNEDVTWTLEEDEFGTVLVLNDGYTGESYRGRFYWDDADARLYVRVRIGEYDLWLTCDPRLVSIGLTEEEALQAIINYINETNESLAGMLEEGQYGVAIGVSTEDDESIRVWLRSYTGAYKFYYIDPVSGETHVTEYAPLMDDATEQPIDESLNARSYLN